jgi:hypothetical protein
MLNYCCTSNQFPVLVDFLEGHPFGSHPQKKKKNGKEDFSGDAYTFCQNYFYIIRANQTEEANKDML